MTTKTLGMDRYPDPSEQEHVLKVNIIEGCTKLLMALKSDRLPDRSQHDFHFLLAAAPPIHMPQLFIDAGIQIDTVSVSLTREDDSPTSIGLDFVDSLGNTYVASTLSAKPADSWTELVRNPHNMRPKEPDSWAQLVLDAHAAIDAHSTLDGSAEIPIIPPEDKSYHEIDRYRLPQLEINSLLQSILSPNKTGDYRTAAAFDFNDPEWFQGFVDALTLRANYSSAAIHYAEPAQNFSRLNSTEFNGELQTLELAGDIDSPLNGSKLDIDYQTGLTMHLLRDLPESDRMTASPDGVAPADSQFYPTAAELKQFHGLITNAYGRLKPAEAVSLDEGDPETEKAVEQKGMIL